jgi:hypothetical protein
MPETGASHVRVMAWERMLSGRSWLGPIRLCSPPLFLSPTRWKVCILWSQLILREKKKYGWSAAPDTLAGCTNVGY